MGRNRNRRQRARTRSRSPPRAFAPAFAPKREKYNTQDHGETQYRYMRDSESTPGNTWNSMDGGKGWAGGKKETKRTWTESGDWKPSEQNHVFDDVANEDDLKRKFVSDQDIMRDDLRAKSDFEAHNANVTAPVAYGTITTMFSHGNAELDANYDSRVRSIDRHGNSTGGARGKMKMRYIDEVQNRLKERDEEIDKICVAYREWSSLDENQKEERRQKALSNRNAMLAKLELDFDETMPEAYKIDMDAMWKKVEIYNREKARVASGLEPESVGLDQSATVDDDNESHLFLQDDDDDDAQSHLFLTDDNEDIPPTPLTQRATSFGENTPAHSFRPASRASSTARSDQISSFARGHGYGSRPRSKPYDHRRRSDRGRSNQRAHWALGQGRDEKKPAYIRKPPPKYKFDSWPEIIPLGDTDQEVEQEYINDVVRIRDFHELCTKESRMVVVALVPEVQYSSTAIMDRIFNGTIQEIQWFPTERQALVAFMSPIDAKAFLDHVRCCLNQSEQEYRRLQIHTSYYKGTVLGGVYPAQKGVLSDMIVNGATRVLSIDKVPKILKHDDMLQIMKSRFWEQHLVRVRLIVPKKMYEQQDYLSNGAVLEFTSIKDAVEAKQMFESKSVEGFKDSSASYLSDPCSKEPVKMPWCNCMACKTPVAHVEETGLGLTLNFGNNKDPGAKFSTRIQRKDKIQGTQHGRSLLSSVRQAQNSVGGSIQGSVQESVQGSVQGSEYGSEEASEIDLESARNPRDWQGRETHPWKAEEWDESVTRRYARR